MLSEPWSSDRTRYPAQSYTPNLRASLNGLRVGAVALWNVQESAPLAWLGMVTPGARNSVANAFRC